MINIKKLQFLWAGFFLLLPLFVLQTPVLADETTTLMVWRGRLATEWDVVQRQMYEEFEKTHPNVRIEDTVMPWGKLREKTLTALRFKIDVPDLLVYEGLNYVSTYASMGGLASLDDYIKDWPESEAIPRRMWEASSYEGHVYALPTGAMPYVTLYNKARFNEVGVSLPTSWDEFVTMLRKLTDPEKDQYAYAMQGTRLLPSFFVQLLWQAGGGFFNDDIRTPSRDSRVTFNDDLGIKALDQLKTRADFAPFGSAGIVSLTDSDVVSLFALGQIAMLPGVSHNYGKVLSINQEMKADIGVFREPAGPAPYGRDVSFVIGQAAMLIADSKNKDIAAEFLRLYLSKQSNVTQAIKLGTVPTRTDIDDPRVSEILAIRVGMESVEKGIVQPDFVEWVEFRDLLKEKIHLALLNKQTSKEVLDQAARVLQEKLEEKD